MADKHAFGDYLTRVMDAADKTIADLERLTGINNSLISKWRAGTSLPGIPNLRLLAPALKVPLLDLVVVAEYLTAEELGMAEAPKAPGLDLTLEEKIRARPGLTDQEREVMINMLNVFESRSRGQRKPRERREA